MKFHLIYIGPQVGDSSMGPFGPQACPLTIGKRYSATSDMDYKKYYLITDDNGIEIWVSKNEFKTLEDYRNEILVEILQ